MSRKNEKRERKAAPSGEKRGNKEGRRASESAVYAALSYEEQLARKTERLKKLLSSFGAVQPILGMEDPLHYRNKVHAVFGRDERGRVLCGEYKEGTHRIIEVKDSPIEDQTARKILLTVRRLVIEFKVRIYDEDLRTGLLRHVVVRRGIHTGEVMVVLVTASFTFPSVKNFTAALLKAHPEITTVVLNVNDRKTSMVLGNKEKVLFGKGYIKDTLLGCTFRISARSFYQVNPKQTEVLYETAIRFADLGPKEEAIDAYCGTGTIGILAAAHAKEGTGSVTGVESNREAVEDARRNAKENKADNITFVCADASDYMEKAAAEGKRVDVLFMDPPRAGADARFLSAAVHLAPKRIVYISCNPETLARDLRHLTSKGYKVKRIQPVDMFPFTEHIETIVLLQKLNS